MRFPTRIPWMFHGRKVVDRGRDSLPSFRSPSPVETTLDEMNSLIDERFGLALCPACGEKVAVLVNGVCRFCQPEDAA